MLQCCALNGGIFLGSIAWWQFLLQPSMQWAMAAGLVPLSGPVAAQRLENILYFIYQALWLAPAYAVILVVSATWYTEMAAAAVLVQPRYSARLLGLQQQQSPSHESPMEGRSKSTGLTEGIWALSVSYLRRHSSRRCDKLASSSRGHGDNRLLCLLF